MNMRYAFTILVIVGVAGLGLTSCGEDDGAGPNSNQIDKSVNQKIVGQSANDFLSDTNFDKLTVEILFVEGFAPTSESLNNLKSFLEARLKKPNGISFTETSIASPGLAPYSIQDLISTEDANRTGYNNDRNIAAYIFFADGGYSEDTDNSKVLGVAYRNTSMAIFQATVKDLSDGAFEPDRTLLESTVLNHEFGHVMGLVNVGTPLQSDHQDTAHGHHCDVENCLMNWKVETGDVVDRLLGSPSVPELDNQCINDLQANGGK